MAENFMQQMPFSATAEQSVLGSILIDPNALNDVLGILKSDDFYIEDNKQIFLAMQKLFTVNKTIDAVTLIDTLVADGIGDRAGMENYLRGLVSSVPDVHNVGSYAAIVKDKHTLRQLIETAHDISNAAYSEQEEVSTILENAENDIFNIRSDKDSKGLQRISDVLTSFYAHLQDLKEHPEETKGINTGFSTLDDFLLGLEKGNFVVLGARPGMGKTSFALALASNIAKSSKKAVAIFSLEMSAEELVARMLSQEASVNSKSLRTGNVSPDEFNALAKAASVLAGTGLLIDDTSGITVMQMKAKLRRVKNLGFVVVDYLGLMTSDSQSENRVQEVTNITRNLKIMAKELRVPILCCCQLNRSFDKNRAQGKNDDSRPQLSDLRDSGSIEQDADAVLLLYRNDYYSSEKSDSSEIEVIVAKNRHGKTGTVKMGWDPQHTMFVTMDNSASAPVPPPER